MPYNIFSINKSLIDSIPTNDNWEIYDESCYRSKIDVPYTTIKKIWSLANIDLPIFDQNNICHRIRYNIKNNYIISNHSDFCNLTIIIYKYKDKTLDDNFYIENKLVTENLWNNNSDSYSALAMWNHNKIGPEHYGNIIGTGKREVICLFL